MFGHSDIRYEYIVLCFSGIWVRLRGIDTTQGDYAVAVCSAVQLIRAAPVGTKTARARSIVESEFSRTGAPSLTLAEQFDGRWRSNSTLSWATANFQTPLNANLSRISSLSIAEKTPRVFKE